MVNIKIQFNNQILTLPVNPEELNIDRDADNEKAKVVKLGNIIIKGEVGLRKVSIESFFPSSNSDFYTGVRPSTCVSFLEKIWQSDKVARITTEGLPINLNMYFLIDSFSYDSKAGEEDDIYYDLSITEYKPYGVKLVNMRGGTAYGVLDTSNRVDTKKLIEQTYTVISGDTLIGITKKICGDTTRWSELYNNNKAVIGNNPNLIYPGTKLILPESWVIK